MPPIKTSGSKNPSWDTEENAGNQPFPSSCNIFQPKYKEWIPRKWLRSLAYGLVAAVVIGSFLPPAQKTEIGTQHHNASKGTGPSLRHRAYHFLSFGVTSIAFLLLAEGLQEEVRSAARIVALGVAIELAQAAVTKDHLLEWWDIRDDFFAVIAAILLIQAANLLSRRWSVLGLHEREK